MMKLFVVYLAIICVIQTEAWTRKSQDDIKDVHIECIAKYPIPEANIAEMKHFVYPDEEPVRKYIQCIAEKLEYFGAQEGFHNDNLIEQYKGDMPEAEIKGIVDICIDKNEQGSPVDVWCFRSFKCFMASKAGQFTIEYLKKTVAS